MVRAYSAHAFCPICTIFPATLNAKGIVALLKALNKGKHG